AGPGGGRHVTFLGGHDAALHQDVPFAGEGVRVTDARLRGQPDEVTPDVGQVLTGRLVHRMLRVTDFDHYRQERAALEVRPAEPLAEHVEDGQQLLARGVAAADRK